MIGLLAAIGLRIGEAIKLDRSDVDWTGGVLLTPKSKFGKSRLVPLHVTSMTALADYAALRDRHLPRPVDGGFSVSLRGKPLLYAVVSQTFRRLVDATGVGAHSPYRRGYTIFGTPSRSAVCSTGITRAGTSRPRSPRCRPTSGTAARARPTGTCPPPPSCWRQGLWRSRPVEGVGRLRRRWVWA